MWVEEGSQNKAVFTQSLHGHGKVAACLSHVRFSWSILLLKEAFFVLVQGP